MGKLAKIMPFDRHGGSDSGFAPSPQEASAALALAPFGLEPAPRRVLKFIAYGGCVTRDVFEHHPEILKNGELAYYYSRTTPGSYISKPFSLDMDLPNIGKFQARIMHEDASKSFGDFLRSRPDFDILVCDFISAARLRLYELEGGKIGTLNTLTSKIFRDQAVPFHAIEIHSGRYKKLLDKGLSLFIDFSRKNSRKRKILINKVYYSNNYNDGNASSYPIDRYNERLDYIYDRLESSLGSDALLTYTPDELICDVRHKWSKAPFHYVPEFYASQARQIMAHAERLVSASR